MESVRDKLRGIENGMNRMYVKNTPRIPRVYTNVLATFLPYIIALSVVPVICNMLVTFGVVRNPFVSLIAGIGGFISVFAPDAFGYIGRSAGVTFSLSIAWLLTVVASLPYLMNRRKRGWRLVFYATMITMLDAFLYLDLGTIVAHLFIVWYLLFQIKSLYRKS